MTWLTFELCEETGLESSVFFFASALSKVRVMHILLCFLFSFLAQAEDRAGSITYDLGASVGVSGGGSVDRNYTEVNLGLSWYAADFLAWRNSGFARFLEGADTGYGLDTSLRLIGDLGSSTQGVSVFVAPGYRFASSSVGSAPFAEEGLTLLLGGLRIGGGAKQIFHQLVEPGREIENQYFIILGGGGRL